jgi:hypothetical protein
MTTAVPSCVAIDVRRSRFQWESSAPVRFVRRSHARRRLETVSDKASVIQTSTYIGSPGRFRPRNVNLPSPVPRSRR